jgi:hypothetical protein
MIGSLAAMTCSLGPLGGPLPSKKGDFSVHFEDGRRVTTNYMGDVLQVGDVFTFEGRNWVVTDAKALGEREVDFEIHVRRAEEE